MTTTYHHTIPATRRVPRIKDQGQPCLRCPCDQFRVPAHPFWCDECGAHAGFSIKGCPIPHRNTCARYGENPETVYTQAVTYVQATGRTIP
jgi:hypothetical protein